MQKYSYDLSINTNFSYNSFFNKWILGLSFGITMNKITNSSYRKPVVYFYPKDTMDLEVILDFKGKFTFTWPLYRDKWKIKIYPDSKIFNISDGKYYGYLFWEGTYATPSIDTIKTGFIVEKNEMASFLNEKLSFIGLNDRETNDFITYWVPLLKSDKYLIHFVQNEKCEFFAKYNFSKLPDTFIRVMVLFIPIDKNYIEEQKLFHNARRGFTVVEWGGIEL